MFIIYKRTSPSGHSYIGYTKLPLMRRWKISIQECRTSRKGSPLANAILKYGSENWSHEILFETDDELLAKDAEAVYITSLKVEMAVILVRTEIRIKEDGRPKL